MIVRRFRNNFCTCTMEVSLKCMPVRRFTFSVFFAFIGISRSITSIIQDDPVGEANAESLN